MAEEKGSEPMRVFRMEQETWMGPVWDKFRARQYKIKIMQVLYETDDIFRKEVDALNENAVKRKMTLEQIEAKSDELIKEAEYRHFIASFENMKKNYEARKKEMEKLSKAFKR